MHRRPADGLRRSPISIAHSFTILRALTAIFSKKLTIFQNWLTRRNSDLRRGAAISGIKLTYGKGTNLLLAPMQTSVRDARDIVFSDVFDRKPRVRRTHGSGLTEVVEVEVRLLDQRGAASGFGKLFDGKF